MVTKKMVANPTSTVFPTGIPFLKNSHANGKIQTGGVEKSLIMLLGINKNLISQMTI